MKNFTKLISKADCEESYEAIGNPSILWSPKPMMGPRSHFDWKSFDLRKAVAESSEEPSVKYPDFIAPNYPDS